MEFLMNEKVIEVTITSKDVHMNNDHKIDSTMTITQQDKQSTPVFSPNGSYFHLIRTETKTKYQDTSYYDNYTVTKIEAIDKDDKKYTLRILREDFLPMVGDTLKVCINEHNIIIGYIPYTNAAPISMIKQHKFDSLDFYRWSFIIHAFPITAPFYALAGLKPVKRFSDGEYKNSYFFALFALLIVAIQVYSSYNLYQYGGDAFLKSIIGYVISGVIYISAMLLFDVREFASKSLYISKIKQMLK